MLFLPSIFTFMEPGTADQWKMRALGGAFQSEKLHLMGRSSEYRSL